MMSKKQTDSQIRIHSTAIVSAEASIGSGVEIGPYSIVGPQVKIGKGTILSSHVHVEGSTEIGDRCRVFSGAVLGAAPQTRPAKAVKSRLRIGDDNVIREHVTINAGMKDGSETVVGDRNFLMAGAHIAHDCMVGSDVVMANLATLGGHVVIEDGAVLGGFVGVHQFVRIGRLAMVGGLSKVVVDVPPFAMVDGHPARFHGPNAVGLKRAGRSQAQRVEIKKALKMLFSKRVNLSRVIPEVRREFKSNPDVQDILAFVEKSKRGVVRSSLASEE